MTRLALAATLALALALPFGAGADDTKKEQAFQNPGESYEMTGTISEVEDDDVKLTRQGLPNAELDIVSKKTKVTLNGRDVSLDELQPGMEVRAQFQVVGSDVVATRIEATPKAGAQQPGAQPPGSQQPGSGPGAQPGE
ncbi:MAG TPA: hypothetical protein VN033_04920 [Vulgatibacter sp.]|nr:hypothetical protein [Vulgatibacter sp.]